MRKLYVYFAALFCVSCSLDIKQDNEFADPYAIVDAQTGREFLASVYSGYPQFQYELSTLADDFYPSRYISTDGSLRQFYNWAPSEITAFSDVLWVDLYNRVLLCNTLTERVEKIVGWREDAALLTIMGEAKAVKAMCYLDLLRLFAPIYDPATEQDGIVLRNDLQVSAPARSSIKESVAEIEMLLTEAVDMMTVAPTSKFWLSKECVQYMLCELYLYSYQPEKLLLAGSELFAKYTPELLSESAYGDIWSGDGDSDELIFAFSVDLPFYTALQYDGADTYFVMNDEVATATGDYRSEWLSSYHDFADLTGGGVSQYRVFGKYHTVNMTDGSVRYVTRMRAEGAILMQAEALILTGDVKGGVELMSDYLESCGAEPLVGVTDADEALEELFAQRRVAFVGEGERYFDLKRQGGVKLSRYNAYGKGTYSTVAANDYRWCFSIPRSEYRNNLNVKQNPGWPYDIVQQ